MVIIISEKNFVVNYDTDGSISTIFDKVIKWKKSLKEVSKDTQNFVASFKRIGKDNANIDTLTQRFSDVDQTVVKVAEQVKAGDASIDDLDAAMNNAATTGSKFAASLKSIGANMAIIAFINLAIHVASKIWDHFNVTTKEAKEKVDNLTSSISNLNSEIQTLRTKDELTGIEQRRLEYLESRLKLEEQLLEVEKARYAQELLGSPDKITDWFDDDNYLNKGAKEFGTTYQPFTALSILGFLFTPVGILSAAQQGKNALNEIDSLFNGADAVLAKGETVSREIQDTRKALNSSLQNQNNYALGSEEYQKNLESSGKLQAKLNHLMEDDATNSYSDLLEKYNQYLTEQQLIEEQLENGLLPPETRGQYENLLKQYQHSASEIRATINDLAAITGNPDWWIGELDFSSWEHVEQYLYENVLSALNATEGQQMLSDAQTMFEIQTRFNDNRIPVGDYQDKLHEFLDAIANLPEDTQKYLHLLFGLRTDDDGTVVSDVNTLADSVKAKLQDEFGKLRIRKFPYRDSRQRLIHLVLSYYRILKRVLYNSHFNRTLKPCNAM